MNRPGGHPHYQPQLLLNNGVTLLPSPAGALPSLRTSVGALAVADIDRNGMLDLFVGGRVIPGRYPLAPRSTLLKNEAGNFADATALADGLAEIGLVTSALFSDVNDDGWPDLLVALEWGGVRYFQNLEGRGFRDCSDSSGFSAAGTGWWTSLAAADFNEDGRLDYVAGNVGLNTPYHATPAEPALLFYGEFEEKSQPQIVEAYHQNNKLYPRRGSQQLPLAAPSIARRFTRVNDYARATLPELLDPKRLDAAQRFAATELRSGVFLSQPDGTHRFTALPRIAQIAPMQGIATGDFDGDGHADLYTVQNSYAPIPLVGRFHGGISQLLHGDGRGNWTAVPPSDSNLVVSGDAKALASVDLDRNGWADFVVT
ncbi:MAG TPA: VCBS repeat-containing protein, partial [Opitutus sp.]|nr:VCBS repeat-containing protein [Opitutus sp.]